MRYTIGTFVAPLLFGLVLVGAASAQSLTDNLPEGVPVFAGEIRPITAPIRLRFTDSLPLETSMELVVVLEDEEPLEAMTFRGISEISGGGTLFNVDVKEMSAPGLPAFPDGTNIMEISWQISPNRRELGDVMVSNFPGFTAVGITVIPAMEQAFLASLEQQAYAFTETIHAAGDSVVQDPLSLFETSQLPQGAATTGIKSEAAAVGLSTDAGRDVLVTNLTMTVKTLVEDMTMEINGRGYSTIDLKTGHIMSSVLRLGTQIKNGDSVINIVTFASAHSRYLTEADRPRRGL